jgi:integrase
LDTPGSFGAVRRDVGEDCIDPEAAMARPSKPYHHSRTNDPVPGLYRSKKDGRWRIVATGQKFTEPDEDKAIEYFERVMKRVRPKVAMTVTETSDPHVAAVEMGKALGRQEIVLTVPRCRTEKTRVRRVLPGAEVANWLRDELTNRPAELARMIGMPELAKFARESIRQAPVTIDAIREAYKKHSPATEKAKKEALAPFEKLVRFAEATTLDDLDEPTLAAWRDQIVNHAGLTSSGTISSYFSRVRNVLRIAGRGELDAVQLEAAITRCRAKLYSPPNTVHDDPQPISKENFQKLLGAVGETDVPEVWRAMLLLGLNAALYMEDVCDLQWDALDLDAGTLVSRRKKTGKCMRVATLWPETVAALRAIPRRGQSPYVFTSPHGTRYNKNTKINDFKDASRRRSRA